MDKIWDRKSFEVGGHLAVVASLIDLKHSFKNVCKARETIYIKLPKRLPGVTFLIWFPQQLIYVLSMLKKPICASFSEVQWIILW